MRKPQNIIAGAAATLLIALALLLLPIARLYDTTALADRLAAWPQGHGCDGALNANCGMNNFVPIPQGAAPAGWTPFVISGSLAIDGPHEDTYWGAPSVRLWSDGDVFDAGLYTQVGGLTPGATYFAAMGWGAPKSPEDSFGRRLGIDPTGGTDPNSPNVVWGPEWRGPGKVLNDSNPGYINIDVSTVAKASTVTLFFRVNHNYSTGQNEIFIDAVGLYQSDAPIAPPPTNTSPPAPTAAPKPTQAAKAAAPPRVPPTATAAPTATLPPTDTPTPAPTDTPAPTATPTLTATPTQTLTPSVTPSSTLPPRPRATAATESRGVEVEVSSATAPPQVLLFGGIGALAGAGALGLVMVARRRR